MQISTMSDLVSLPQSSSTYSSTYLSEKTASEQTSLSVDYDGAGNISQVTYSKSSSYQESTYSSEGLMVQSSSTPYSALESGSLTESGSARYSQYQYLDVLRQRVTYLLNELISFIENRDDSGSKDTSSGNAQSLSLYSMYSERTVTYSESFTVEGISISSDYYSSEKTAERIVNFALSFYNGEDRGEYVSEIKAAILEGFSEAIDILGGSTPEIQDTKNLVLTALEDFASGEPVNYSA